MPALTTTDLQAFLDRNAIPGTILTLAVPTPTVETAAQAVNAQPDQILKSVVFLINGEPVVAMACGQARIDRRAIAAQFGVGRKRVKLADAETVLRVTGYPAGAVPPFGYPRRLPGLLDFRVLTHEMVYAGGGKENALLRLSPQEVLRVTQGVVLDLLSSPSQS